MASNREAMKAVYDAVYNAAMAGKPISQGAANKIYDEVVGTAKKTTVPTNAAYNQINARTGKNPLENNAALDILKEQTAATTSSPFSALLNKSAQNANTELRKKGIYAPEFLTVEDFKTTQQKQADAQKAYDDYVNSDTYKNKQAAGATDTSALFSDNVPSQRKVHDEKEAELRAVNDYYKRQVQAEEDQKVMETDLAELATWSDEDRRNLDKYIAERDTHAMNALNPFVDQGFDKYNMNPIVDKYGIAKVRQMAESVQRSRNAETTKQVQQEASNIANNNPVAGGIAGSVLSVPASFAGSITSPLSYAVELGQRTGRYSTLDPNNIGNAPSVFSETVRGEVAGNIRGDENNTNWLRQLAAIGYWGGMSAIDSAVRTIASGGSAGVSAAIASSGAFGSTLRSASQQGATPAQAATMALADAGLEYITEKIPTEQVLDMFKKGDNTSAVKNVLKQAFLVEPTSEEVNLFAGVAAETLILGDKSSNNQRLGELIANGMSYEEAKAQIYKELWKEAAQTYAVSAFSGGLSAAGATLVGNVANRLQQEGKQQAEAAAPLQQEAKSAEDVLAEAVGAELAQNAPAPTPAQPMTENQQHLENGIAATMGVEQEALQQVENRPVERISLEDYANNQSPVWNNVAYEDDATKTAITQEVHNKMVESGAVVNVSEDILKSTEQSYPDLRGMKKQERIPVLKEAVKALKNNLRQFLNTFKDQSFEFEVNGKILDAKLYNTGINEVLEKVTKEKANMLYSTEDIFKNAQYLYSTPDYDGDPNVQRWNYFYTPVKIGDETVGVRIAIRDVANPQESQIYNWGIKKDAPLSGARRGTNDRIPSGASSDASTNIIQSNEAEVKGIGAAEQDFSKKAQYQDLLYEGNVQADRATDARPMELPLTDAQGEKVSAVTSNVYGSKITPDYLASLMEEPVARGDFSYMPISNDKATEMALDSIASAGNWTDAYSKWKEQVAKGNAGAEMAARGALLLNKAAQDGNKDEWLSTLRYMQKLGTNTAQGLQAMKLIRELTPPDKVAFMESLVTDLSESLGMENDLKIDPALIDEFNNAKTDEKRDEVVKKIQKNVAEQIPSTWLDKWTALRYTNMLGNLKTQVRNLAGNIGSMAVYRVKDTIATGIEAIASAVSGGKLERTKSLTTSKALRDACNNYFMQDNLAVSGGGKFGERMSAADQFTQGIQDDRRIFKSNAKNPVAKKVGDIAMAPMEGYRRATNWMMNNEYFGDEAFGRVAYNRAMAGYLKAHGVEGSDFSKVDKALINDARKYAIREAQEATFHDNTQLAKIMSKLQKGTGLIGQGIMPFTKTPANILTRAEEFSPLGLINSTVQTVQKAKGSDEITGADVVNSWAKTLTGTALFMLGAAMFDQGLLAGGPDEDEEKAKFDTLNGAQNYAITLPNGTNYTLDWLTPAAMPMFMGAQFWKAFSDQDITIAEAEQALTSIADPMIQMSMLQGLNDSLDGIKYSENNLGQFLLNYSISYLTQGLTNTLLGQVERSTEEKRQTTFVDKDSQIPQWLQKQLGKASQKIPGWDYQQTDYRNAWGETEENEGGLLYNLLSPGYLSKEESSALSDELYRLRETTGENVFPQSPEKALTYTDKDGKHHENKNLTAEEYETMQKAEGQTAARILNEATSSTDYAYLTDAQKAKVVKLAYEYAREQGRVEAIADYKGYSESWMQNISGKEAKTIVNKVVGADIKNALDSLSNAWSNQYDTTEPLEALEAAHTVYSNMSQATRKAVKDDATGRVAAYLEARNHRISTETFTDLYKTYWELDKSSKKQKDKAEQWAYTLEKAQESGKLTATQKDALKEALGFSQTMRVETEKFDALADSGLSANDTQTVTKAINSLIPEDGKSQVSDRQKWDAICKTTLDDVSKDAAIKTYMQDYDPTSSNPVKTELKYDYVRQEMGLSPESYTKIYKAYTDVKNMDSERLDAIGTTRKEEYYRRWTAEGMTRSQATELYNLFVTNGKKKIDVVAWYEDQQ